MENKLDTSKAKEKTTINPFIGLNNNRFSFEKKVISIKKNM
jgi:hypothetical protein